MSFLHMFALLFAVGNPIDDLPLFLTMTRGKKAKDVQLMILVACLVAFGISVLFLYFGMAILDAFDIGIEAFRIAGGLVIGLIGFKLLLIQKEKEEEEIKEKEKEVEEQTAKENLISKAIVPLAIPLLAGPASISAIVLLASHQDIPNLKILIVIAALIIFDYLVFLLAGKLAKFLGDIGIEVISKLMGIIMIAMGVQYIIFGLTNSFPGWVN